MWIYACHIKAEAQMILAYELTLAGYSPKVNQKPMEYVLANVRLNWKIWMSDL